MFEITVQTDFSAAHAISIAGTREPLHGHNWYVTVTLAGHTLDADGLLCDFHTVHDTLLDITTPFNNQNLNDLAPFAPAPIGNGVNPSAENVARHIADSLVDRLGTALAPVAWVASVSVTEAHGCVATYRPSTPNPSPSRATA